MNNLQETYVKTLLYHSAQQHSFHCMAGCSIPYRRMVAKFPISHVENFWVVRLPSLDCNRWIAWIWNLLKKTRWSCFSVNIPVPTLLESNRSSLHIIWGWVKTYYKHIIWPIHETSISWFIVPGFWLIAISPLTVAEKQNIEENDDSTILLENVHVPLCCWFWMKCHILAGETPQFCWILIPFCWQFSMVMSMKPTQNQIFWLNPPFNKRLRKLWSSWYDHMSIKSGDIP